MRRRCTEKERPGAARARALDNMLRAWNHGKISFRPRARARGTRKPSYARVAPVERVKIPLGVCIYVCVARERLRVSVRKRDCYVTRVRKLHASSAVARPGTEKGK